MFFAIIVLPSPLLPIITQLRGCARKSRVRARSIKGRSIFLAVPVEVGHGFEAAEGAWARASLEAARARSAVSERAISSAVGGGSSARSRREARRSSRPCAVSSRPKMVQLGGQIMIRVRGLSSGSWASSS